MSVTVGKHDSGQDKRITPTPFSEAGRIAMAGPYDKEEDDDVEPMPVNEEDLDYGN